MTTTSCWCPPSCARHSPPQPSASSSTSPFHLQRFSVASPCASSCTYNPPILAHPAHFSSRSLHGLLAADLIGFQTANFARHFRQTVSRILSLEAVPKGVTTHEGK